LKRLFNSFVPEKNRLYIANFILIGVYPMLTVFHFHSSLSLRFSYQPSSALHSLTNQCPIYFSTNQLVSTSTSACFNVAFTYKYGNILFSSDTSMIFDKCWTKTFESTKQHFLRLPKIKRIYLILIAQLKKTYNMIGKL